MPAGVTAECVGRSEENALQCMRAVRVAQGAQLSCLGNVMCDCDGKRKYGGLHTRKALTDTEYDCRALKSRYVMEGRNTGKRIRWMLSLYTFRFVDNVNVESGL